MTARWNFGGADRLLDVGADVDREERSGDGEGGAQSERADTECDERSLETGAVAEWDDSREERGLESTKEGLHREYSPFSLYGSSGVGTGRCQAPLAGNGSIAASPLACKNLR